MISNIENMEEKESQLQRELVRAEKSLIFMQKEHAKILDGLHQEIQSLTQKCSGKVLRSFQSMDSNFNFTSDLQFSLAMQSDAKKEAEIQREAIKKLQYQHEQLQTNHTNTVSQLDELNSMLSWERLQHNNLVESLKRQLEEKDVKIMRLSKDFELKVYVLLIKSFSSHRFCIE